MMTNYQIFASDPKHLNTTTIGQSPRRVKAAFMWPFALVLAAILLVFAIAAYLLEGRVRDQALTERVEAVRTLLTQKIAKDADLMQATLRALMANRNVQDALVRRDRDALLHDLGPLFATLRDQHRITHLYIDDPELVNVARLHSPTHFGDVISRLSATRARDTGQAVHGLELGPLGTLTLRDDELPALGLQVNEAAKQLGVSRVELSRVLNGRAAISPDMALRLKAWLGVERVGDTRAWLAQQSAYDLWLAAQRFKVAPMRIQPATAMAAQSSAKPWRVDLGKKWGFECALCIVAA